MPRLKIRHETVYSYSQPVTFGAWRLLMRPTDTHATRLIEATLETPPADLTWSYDAYGNGVCHLQPHAPASQLKVVNNLVVERYPSPLADLYTDSPSLSGPVVYSRVDRIILEPFIAPATDDDDANYRAWLGAVAPRPDETAIESLRRINAAIQSRFGYGVRYDEGTQGPGQTVAQGTGTCRDFAWLLVESIRRFGFAARFATGYLYAPGAVVRGAGATHAWCEVFLPRMGWMDFDPTNALVESSSLIRVATARTWQECAPMSGTVFGNAACDLTVAVDVDLIDGG